MPATSKAPEARPLHVAALVALVLLLVGAAFWWSRDDAPAQGGGDVPAGSAPSGPTTSGPAPESRPARLPRHPRVVVVSVDGLASYAVTPQQMPVLTGLLEGGAGTLNARTAVERTVTLPNHTGMVTGRRIDAAAGGHGVTWNVDSPRNVRPGVPSVFSVIHAAGGSSAVFAGKTKFRMWDRSWPGTIDEFVVDEDLAALTDAVVDDLEGARRDLVFLHIGLTDATGHASGWDSPAYDAAVTRADDAIGRVVDAIEEDPRRAAQTIVVVTADHGGPPGGKDHGDASALVDFQVPFVVWGPGVAAEDLYVLNPDYADPGDAQPSYDAVPPVRNAAVANLVTDLLGLGPVPGSQVDALQDLDVQAGPGGRP
ncbi:hypothetical protein BJ993_001235 [Nocardioides aromaticivorans]|uniref:Type I phosphodiesterase/nucleotide pyrophosphatase n=1 Tax=Nocardioides aromaticivorans TaxID=200618 RepID=A0A7Y9ZHP3_9ACTN|nr:alkaline phosphatase family protein [Nocardioides aromaticivorans]NYI44155.1 hypothetical protein [Nocardioides aromaticivorans]